jgi:hypothetical protein
LGGLTLKASLTAPLESQSVVAITRARAAREGMCE